MGFSYMLIVIIDPANKYISIYDILKYSFVPVLTKYYCIIAKFNCKEIKA
jgi:hypothetical protein